MTKQEFLDLIEAKVARGLTRAQAERAARKERRKAHPAHKAAQARRWALAQEARDGRAAMEALRAG